VGGNISGQAFVFGHGQVACKIINDHFIAVAFIQLVYEQLVIGNGEVGLYVFIDLENEIEEEINICSIYVLETKIIFIGRIEVFTTANIMGFNPSFQFLGTNIWHYFKPYGTAGQIGFGAPEIDLQEKIFCFELYPWTGFGIFKTFLLIVKAKRLAERIKDLSGRGGIALVVENAFICPKGCHKMPVAAFNLPVI
jgi:hypothetical protein